jgi:hypothetical protein
VVIPDGAAGPESIQRLVAPRIFISNPLNLNLYLNLDLNLLSPSPCS